MVSTIMAEVNTSYDDIKAAVHSSRCKRIGNICVPQRVHFFTGFGSPAYCKRTMGDLDDGENCLFGREASFILRNLDSDAYGYVNHIRIGYCSLP